jgi:hypothetical protein
VWDYDALRSPENAARTVSRFARSSRKNGRAGKTAVVLHAHHTPSVMVLDQETNLFLQNIGNFKDGLNARDDDEKSLISSLNYTALKLMELQVSSVLRMTSAVYE